MYLFFDQSRIRIALTCLLIWTAQLTYAQLQVLASRSSANYEAGELMYFEVTSETWGPVDYVIRFDPKMPALAAGSIIVNPNTPSKIPFVLEEPGSVLCSVRKDSLSAVGGAVFSRYDVTAFEEEPQDFDNFWNGVKAELANVPIDPVLTFLDSSDLSITYRMNLGNIDNRRVYGYISIPKGTPPYPAILTLPPFGDVANVTVPERVIAEWGGAISVTISIHNVEPDQTDPNAYLPNDISDPNGIYYKQAITGAIRTIDYIFSRSDFNGVDMGVTGLSQGGGLALITAGVDSRVKSLLNTVSVLSGHAGHRYNRPSGLPLYIYDSRGTNGTIEHEDATLAASKYYDGIFFAKRYDGPALSFISYADTISPAATFFGALNELRGSGIIMHNTSLGHGTRPSEYWEMRYEFWRNTFPAMQVNPFPWSLTTTGFAANVGNDLTISAGGTANLTATVTNNEAPLNDLKARWIKVNGPGKVSFSNPNAYNTTATFSQNGIYTLKFVATIEPDLETEREFYTVYDFVEVTVGN